ncbi:ABC transporter substrate-binding protein [Rivibacter subsaxonicus]|uniref:Oligogalacturonide-binding protein n=1 Tax=Rivibacter subsaxonicus TaxID=457575 RepID=A0A4Q7V8X1_9BURK|nr:ABC transporter substrate-binding protein [Rivibacter subsaxonicus]RZT91960.1 oligogalacturonide-binding protein [Rivibacter subsaxonicus]
MGGLVRRRLVAGGIAMLGAPALLRAQPQSVLRFAWWGGAARHEATLKAIALFEAQNPGLRVKAEYMGFAGYLERLTTQIAGRSEPDLMQINWAWLAMFSKRGNGFVDLYQHRKDLALQEFDADDLAFGEIGGKLNALPVSFSARVMLWNQAAFERARVSLPRDWDELFAAGRSFRRNVGEHAFPLDGELYDMMLLAHAYVEQKHGAPYVDPLQPRVAMSPAAALDWVQTYQRLVGEHVATPLPLRASLGGAEKPTEQQPDWVVGNWAGNYTWDSVIPLRAATLDRNQQLVLGEFPTRPGAMSSGMFGRPTVMFAVGRNSRQPQLAARLANFLATDPDAARILGRTRGVPSAKSQFQVLLAANKLPALELAAHEQILQQRRSGRLPRPSPLFEHARMHRFMRDVFETVAYGKSGSEAAAARLVAEGNALLQRIK